jgi:hypothetical protein
MHAPAVALAWEFWWRHRWGLIGVGVLVAGFAAACAASPFEQNTAMVHSIWFVIGLLYAVSVFSYGFEARMEAAESGFPVRHYTLPVRTSVLVGWPMIQGMAVAVALWLAWEHLVLRPSKIETPAWWPAILAAIVATGQAILWFPFGVPWLRILVGCAVLSALARTSAIYDALAPSLSVPREWVTDPDNRNGVIIGIAAMFVPVAFLVARLGVGWARRGDSPDWLRVWQPLRRSAEPQRERAPFASALRAQAWYDWRLRGRGFVMTVVAIIAVVVGLAFVFGSGSRSDYGLIFLFIPVLIATFWGSQMGSPGESFRSTALTAFAATRPMADAVMVAAKLRAATRTAVVAWLVVAGLTAGWFALTDGFDKMQLAWEGTVAKVGLAHARGILVLWSAALVLGTWRALVVNLWVGLCGRTWMVSAHMILIALVGLQLLAQWAFTMSDLTRRGWFEAALPWMLGGVVALKFALAGWAISASRRRGLLSAGTAGKLVGLWCLAAALLFALLAWLVPTDMVETRWLAFAVVLFLPLGRLLAAPLALAWNRHR